MTFLQLNYIMEIYNCGSINKAAQKLFLSQSSLSSSIRELEQELNIKIFKRSNKGIELTEDGMEFITQIKPIVEQQKLVENYYINRSNDDFDSLNVASQRYPFCAKAFVKLISMKDVSRFRYRYTEAEMDRVIESVSERKSEIGVIFLSDITEKFIYRGLASKDLEFHELMRIKPHAFINVNHPLAGKEKIKVSELLDFPYVTFDKKNNESLNYSEEAIIPDMEKFKKIIYVNDRASCYNMLINTNAVTTGSGIIPEGYGDERLITIPIDDATDMMRLGWIKIKEIALSQTAEEYIRILEKTIREKNKNCRSYVY
ncbi:HTH-type transcriptional regulator GltC [Clostridiales bacterium]|nr:HTH-type transcriptional regulator GltC [Clostridiales bacterium]